MEVISLLQLVTGDALLPRFVVFGSPDMGKTHLFFLLALHNDALHLRWLSRLAWIVRSPGRLTRLIESSSAACVERRVWVCW